MMFNVYHIVEKSVWDDAHVSPLTLASTLVLDSLFF